MTPTEAFVELGMKIYTSSYNNDACIQALKALGGTYGIDMDAVEVQFRKGNAAEVAAKLKQDEPVLLAARLMGNSGFHVSQLASCVCDPSTGLDIVTPIGEMLGFLLVLEELEKLSDA